MKNRVAKVAVASRSFSQNPVLRAELLERYENVTFNEEGVQFEGEKLIGFLRGHDKCILGLERVDDSLLAALPELKLISKYGVGLDKIDMEAIRSRRVRFAWKGGVNKRSVAELALSMMIVVLRKLQTSFDQIREGVWKQQVGGLVSGRTVGIIGFGHVGRDLAGLLSVFGSRVLVHDILDLSIEAKSLGAEQVPLQTLLKESDIVTLHVPFDESTRHMIAAAQLSTMKPGSVLINTARGGLVDELALESALNNGPIAGAAFDVFEVEPPRQTRLIRHPKMFATQHLGGSAYEAILAMGRAAIQGLDDESLLLA